MELNQIQQQISHRPFECPDKEWKFYQEWNKAIFLHWEVNPEQIEPFLPKEMNPDIINGKTWISLVAFNMNKIGIRHMPKVPYISDFLEINIRVYVVCNNKPSVYFLSMEGSKRSSCKILKTISKFPYRYSKMSRDDFTYKSRNKMFHDALNIEYDLSERQVEKDETDLWLTERYAVFQDYKKYIIEYDVHHIEWPMRTINIKHLVLDYPRFNHIITNQPDKVHYSPGVQVLTWDKRMVLRGDFD